MYGLFVIDAEVSMSKGLNAVKDQLTTDRVQDSDNKSWPDDGNGANE